MNEQPNPHIGSDFDDFLREEGILEEVEAAAIKKVVVGLIEQAMNESHVSKSEMARRLGTSRTQLDRLMDPESPSLTLASLIKVARVVGRKLSISFEEANPA